MKLGKEIIFSVEQNSKCIDPKQLTTKNDQMVHLLSTTRTIAQTYPVTMVLNY